jgi:indole-3-glycerol phosphate synthase
MAKSEFLKNIVRVKREKIALVKQALPEEELKIKVQGLGSPCRAFVPAISKPRQISLIAEIKKASPSRGVIRQEFDLQDIARVYQEAGVQAISVLTEEDHFLGNINYIQEVKAISGAPVLRKDFILEPYQVYESRLYGADAILLIAGLLSKDSISEMMALAQELGMAALVEVHDEKELKKVLNLKCPLIGINNRDLSSMEVDLKTTEKLFPLIPRDKTVVVESGIKSSQDVLFLRILGVSAVLIGGAFMDAENIGRKVEEMMGW